MLMLYAPTKTQLFKGKDIELSIKPQKQNKNLDILKYIIKK